MKFLLGSNLREQLGEAEVAREEEMKAEQCGVTAGLSLGRLCGGTGGGGGGGAGRAPPPPPAQGRGRSVGNHHGRDKALAPASLSTC